LSSAVLTSRLREISEGRLGRSIASAKSGGDSSFYFVLHGM
jgi:hypothetical protein